MVTTLKIMCLVENLCFLIAQIIQVITIERTANKTNVTRSTFFSSPMMQQAYQAAECGQECLWLVMGLRISVHVVEEPQYRI